MHMSVAYHSCYDNIALITTMMKTQQRGVRGWLQAHIKIYICICRKDISRVMNIWERRRRQQRRVKWNKWKRKIEKICFSSRSLFFLRGKIDFLLSLSSSCSCFNFKPQNLFSWMLLVNAHHIASERERYKLPWRYVYLHLNMCVCEWRIITAQKIKKFIDGGERERNRGNLIRWNCTFQIHNAMMIYLLSLVFDTFRKYRILTLW